MADLTADDLERLGAVEEGPATPEDVLEALRLSLGNIGLGPIQVRCLLARMVALEVEQGLLRADVTTLGSLRETVNQLRQELADSREMVDILDSWGSVRAGKGEREKWRVMLQAVADCYRGKGDIFDVCRDIAEEFPEEG